VKINNSIILLLLMFSPWFAGSLFAAIPGGGGGPGGGGNFQQATITVASTWNIVVPYNPGNGSWSTIGFNQAPNTHPVSITGSNPNPTIGVTGVVGGYSARLYTSGNTGGGTTAAQPSTPLAAGSYNLSLRAVHDPGPNPVQGTITITSAQGTVGQRVTQNIQVTITRGPSGGPGGGGGGGGYSGPSMNLRRMPGWIRIVNNVGVDYSQNWLPMRWTMTRNITPFVPGFPSSMTSIGETAWDNSGGGNVRTSLRMMRRPSTPVVRSPFTPRRRPAPPVRRFSTFRDYIRSLKQ